jgi:hypothetical protein
MLKFVFGTGWWVPWHALLLLTALPLAGILYWTRTIKLGTGPNGGDILALGEMMVVFLLIAISLINAVIWAGGQEWSWPRRFLLVPLAVLVAWGVAVAAIIALSDVVIKAQGEGVARELAFMGLLATYGAIYALNLAALSGAREAA